MSTFEETKTMINIWGAADILIKLDAVARNRSVYDKIAATLADARFERNKEPHTAIQQRKYLLLQ